MRSSETNAAIGCDLSYGADVRLLLRMRTIAIIGQTIALIVTALVIKVELNYFILGLGVALLAGVNLYTWMRLVRKAAGHGRVHCLNDRTFFYQILVDIAVLTYLLYFAGGPDNPFHDMYLLPLTVAAASLPWAYTWRVIVASISGYTLVAFHYVPIELDPSRAQDLMVIGEWINHLLLAMLICYFVVRIAAEVRSRDGLLAQAHARELRNGCAVNIGSVAAGTVHELSTPLSTMMTLLNEMRSEHAGNAAIKPSLDLLAGRVEECKQSLDSLRNFIRSFNRGDTPIPVERLLEGIATHFRHLRPDVSFRLSLDSPQPGPLIVPDLALQQAIVNLLNNACDVSPNAVTLQASWTDSMLTLRVHDRGPGISPELADKLGDLPITTKPQGTGVGLFLTNVTMQRLGGRLRLFNLAGGGACAELVLPFNASASNGANV